MKNIVVQAIFISISLLLASCADKKETSAEPIRGKSESLLASEKILENTKAYDEFTVVKAAGLKAELGLALESSVAERCWEEEQLRPAVQEACVLGWSVGDEKSERLSFTLHENLKDSGRLSRSLAIASVRKPNFTASLSHTELIQLLSLLQKDRGWIRGRAAYQWLSKNTFSFFQGELVWERVSSNDAETDPATLFETYLVAKQLGRGHWQSIMDAYCKPGVLGVAQSRCWRFLSTLVDPASGEGLDRSHLPFLRNRRDSGWTLFERSFPERSMLLKQYL